MQMFVITSRSLYIGINPIHPCTLKSCIYTLEQIGLLDKYNTNYRLFMWDIFTRNFRKCVVLVLITRVSCFTSWLPVNGF